MACRIPLVGAFLVRALVIIVAFTIIAAIIFSTEKSATDRNVRSIVTNQLNALRCAVSNPINGMSMALGRTTAMARSIQRSQTGFLLEDIPDPYDAPSHFAAFRLYKSTLYRSSMLRAVLESVRLANGTWDQAGCSNVSAVCRRMVQSGNVMLSMPSVSPSDGLLPTLDFAASHFSVGIPYNTSARLEVVLSQEVLSSVGDFSWTPFHLTAGGAPAIGKVICTAAMASPQNASKSICSRSTIGLTSLELLQQLLIDKTPAESQVTFIDLQTRRVISSFPSVISFSSPLVNVAYDRLRSLEWIDTSDGTVNALFGDYAAKCLNGQRGPISSYTQSTPTSAGCFDTTVVSLNSDGHVVGYTVVSVENTPLMLLLLSTPRSKFYATYTAAMTTSVVVYVLVTLIGLVALMFAQRNAVSVIQVMLDNFKFAKNFQNESVTSSPSFIAELDDLNNEFLKLNDRLLAARPYLASTVLNKAGIIASSGQGDGSGIRSDSEDSSSEDGAIDAIAAAKQGLPVTRDRSSRRHSDGSTQRSAHAGNSLFEDPQDSSPLRHSNSFQRGPQQQRGGTDSGAGSTNLETERGTLNEDADELLAVQQPERPLATPESESLTNRRRNSNSLRGGAGVSFSKESFSAGGLLAATRAPTIREQLLYSGPTASENTGTLRNPLVAQVQHESRQSSSHNEDLGASKPKTSRLFTTLQGALPQIAEAEVEASMSMSGREGSVVQRVATEASHASRASVDTQSRTENKSYASNHTGNSGGDQASDDPAVPPRKQNSSGERTVKSAMDKQKKLDRQISKALSSRDILSFRRCTILYGNVVNFIGSLDIMTPLQLREEHAKLLDTILTALHANKGVLDSFHGDHFMVSFNASTTCSSYADKAVAAYRQIYNTIQYNTLMALRQHLNSDHSAVSEGSPTALPAEQRSSPLAMRWGIATGNALCGNLGCATMMRFGVVGPCVNQSFALMQQAKFEGLSNLCCPATFEVLQGKCLMQHVAFVMLPQAMQGCLVSTIVDCKSRGQQNLSSSTTTSYSPGSTRLELRSAGGASRSAQLSAARAEVSPSASQVLPPATEDLSIARSQPPTSEAHISANPTGSSAERLRIAPSNTDVEVSRNVEMVNEAFRAFSLGNIAVAQQLALRLPEVYSHGINRCLKIVQGEARGNALQSHVAHSAQR